MTADALLESLLLLIVGMGVVFASLLLFAGMIWLFKRVDEGINEWRIRRYAEKIAVLPAENELNDELVAVMAAACAATMKQKVRIRRIQFLGSESGPAWAVTGRLNIMASHLIARRKS